MSRPSVGYGKTHPCSSLPSKGNPVQVAPTWVRFEPSRLACPMINSNRIMTRFRQRSCSGAIFGMCLFRGKTIAA